MKLSSETLIYTDLACKLFRIALDDLLGSMGLLALLRDDLSPPVVTFYAVFCLISLAELSLVATVLALVGRRRSTGQKATLVCLALTNVTALVIILLRQVALFVNFMPTYHKNRDILLNNMLALTDGCVYLLFGLYANAHFYYNECRSGSEEKSKNKVLVEKNTKKANATLDLKQRAYNTSKY
jgi:hypothetical protein